MGVRKKGKQALKKAGFSRQHLKMKGMKILLGAILTNQCFSHAESNIQ